MEGHGVCDICQCTFTDLDELLFHRNRGVPCGKKRHFSCVERYKVRPPVPRSPGDLVCLQGPLEYCFARWCHRKGVAWTRPAPLPYVSSGDVAGEGGGEKKYYPDFYLPQIGVFIETKGKYPEKDVRKMRDVFTAYPGIRICLVRPSDFTVLYALSDVWDVFTVFGMNAEGMRARTAGIEMQMHDGKTIRNKI